MLQSNLVRSSGALPGHWNRYVSPAVLAAAHRAGFWIVGGLLTLIYAAVFGLLGYFLSGDDSIWGWVVFGLSFLLIGGLHLHAREREG